MEQFSSQIIRKECFWRVGAEEGGCQVLSAALPPLPPPRAASARSLLPPPRRPSLLRLPLAGWARCCCYLSSQMHGGKACLRCKQKMGKGNRDGVAEVVRQTALGFSLVLETPQNCI